MDKKQEVIINNTVVLATIVTVTSRVIANLDGNGVDTKDVKNPISGDVLNNLITSRLRNVLAARNL